MFNVIAAIVPRGNCTKILVKNNTNQLINIENKILTKCDFKFRIDNKIEHRTN